MALDLTRTATQIDNMSDALTSRRAEMELRLRRAVGALERLDIAGYEKERRRRRLASSGYSTPAILEPPFTRRQPPGPPEDFSVVAADGSHIDVDRHMAANCFLINIGVAALHYGSQPDAQLYSKPRLYAKDEELVIRDPVTYRQQTIEGAVLGAKRTVEEIRELVEAVRHTPSDRPTLVLIDGSLVMLGLVGPLNQDFVLRELVEDGFVRALDELREIARTRPIVVAGYISLPGSFEVISAMRAMTCPYEPEGAGYRCGPTGPGREACDACLGGVRDRNLFARTLGPLDRSALFGTGSTSVEQYYMGTDVVFFYVNAGEEIGRVEVPSWVAREPELLGLAHTLVVDQCIRGRGYPIALMEAHEQAVVSGSDRRHFCELVEGALQKDGLPLFTSEKAWSKRLRWL